MNQTEWKGSDVAPVKEWDDNGGHCTIRHPPIGKDLSGKGLLIHIALRQTHIGLLSILDRIGFRQDWIERRQEFPSGEWLGENRWGAAFQIRTM
jgi:hypothetical protein